MSTPAQRSPDFRSASEAAAATEMLQRSIARFGEREVRPRLASFDHGDALPASVIASLDELGLLSLGVETHDDRRLLAAALETLAIDAGAPAALVLAHVAARSMLLASGAAVRIDDSRLLGYALYADVADPIVSSGELVLDDAKLTLTGRAEMVVNAPVAHAMVLPARQSSTGEAVLVRVETGTEGMRRGPAIRTLGMRGCPTCDVDLIGVRITPDAVLPGPGDPRIARTLRRLAGPALAVGCGIVQSSLRAALDYARERYQGGSQILEHHEVRAMLAEMLADHASGLTAIDVLCREADAGDDAAANTWPAAQMLALRARTAAVRAASDGMQVLGGYGYMEEFGQERRLRDARQAASFFGRADVTRLAVVEEWLASDAPISRVGRQGRLGPQRQDE